MSHAFPGSRVEITAPGGRFELALRQPGLIGPLADLITAASASTQLIVVTHAQPLTRCGQRCPGTQAGRPRRAGHQGMTS